MNSKSKALHNFEGKKKEIRERLSASKQIESPRAKHIREINEKSHKSGMMITAKARHERRHGKGEKTSKAKALERIKSFSKER